MTDSKFSGPAALLPGFSMLLCFGVVTVSLLSFLLLLDWSSTVFYVPDAAAYCLIAAAISSGSLLRAVLS